MLELAGQDVAPDAEFCVRVLAEARAAGDAVFVDYAQGTEGFVGGVVVAGEGEGVEGVEPAVVGVASLIPRSLCDFEIGGAVRGGCRRRHCAL